MAKRMTSRELTLSVLKKNLGTLLETSPPFRQFVWTLLTDAGIFTPSHSRTSPYDTAYWEGRRSLGLEVLHMLKNVRQDILGLLERDGNYLEIQVTTQQPNTQGAIDEDPLDELDE